MPEQWTRAQFEAYVERQYKDQAPRALGLIARWLERGDGAAVYENAELGHPELGEPKITSFGSQTAQLEPFCEVCRSALDRNMVDNGWVHLEDGYEDHVPVYPPQRLPDVGNQINWRYQLVATYQKEGE